MVSNLLKRALSGFVLVTVFLGSLHYSVVLFKLILLLKLFVMLYEWHKMTSSNLYALAIGYFIIPLSVYIISLILDKKYGNEVVMLYFVTIWIIDSGAFLFGKTLGRYRYLSCKLAPNISPRKTVIGLFGGMFCAVLFHTILYYYSVQYAFYLRNKNFISYNIIIGGFTVISQSSDLFVSFFKRKFGIKDSGNIIPGHGGVLDRFDSIILTAPLLYYIYFYMYNS